MSNKLKVDMNRCLNDNKTKMTLYIQMMLLKYKLHVYTTLIGAEIYQKVLPSFRSS